MNITNKKLVILVILVIILAAGVTYYLRKPSSNKEIAPANMAANEIKKTDFPSDQVPEKFPADIPIEAGATITQNYNATTPDGRFQATRVFETKKTLAENLTIYRDYLTNAGYKIQATVDQPTYKMVYGVKDKATLQVSIDENSQFKTKTVNISFTELLNAIAPATKTINSTK